MKFSAGQIAQILGGKVEGNEHAEVEKLSKIEEGEVGSLTFLSNPVYTPYIYKTAATIVIVQEDFKAEKEINSGTTLIRVADPYTCFGKLLELYNTAKHSRTGIEKNANVSDSAKLGENIYIGSGSYIGENVTIGNNTKIYPNCFIGDNVTIGDNCILHAGIKVYLDSIIGNDCIFHAGTVIGGDGFGFSPSSENNFAKIPQIGNVIIEDLVEIGSNCAIDRATMGSTIIRKGVKLDNLVQIAHNVEIGENCVLAAQTGVAGSTKMGKNCMVGGQVGIVGHIKIGDNVKIAAQSGVISDVKDNEIVQGAPAFKYTDYNRSYVLFRSFPKVIDRFNKIERIIKENFTDKNE